MIGNDFGPSYCHLALVVSGCVVATRKWRCGIDFWVHSAVHPLTQLSHAVSPGISVMFLIKWTQMQNEEITWKKYWVCKTNKQTKKQIVFNPVVSSGPNSGRQSRQGSGKIRSSGIQVGQIQGTGETNQKAITKAREHNIAQVSNRKYKQNNTRPWTMEWGVFWLLQPITRGQ